MRIGGTRARETRGAVTHSGAGMTPGVIRSRRGQEPEIPEVSVDLERARRRAIEPPRPPVGRISAVERAASPGLRQLIAWETSANPAGSRSQEPVEMPFVDVPLAAIQLDAAPRLAADVRKALIVERRGGPQARWFLNPEDTLYKEQILAGFAARLGKAPKVRTSPAVLGYRSASRSYFVEDNERAVVFAVKASTNNTGGAWQKKHVDVALAVDGRTMADLLAEQHRLCPFKHFKVMDEPLSMALPGLDFAVIVRDLGLAQSGGRYLLPAFSALHETVGPQIAAANGSADPYVFWTQHLVRPLARALGELRARVGAYYDSRHMQQFLVELDAAHRPTGTIVLRDCSDIVTSRRYVEMLLGQGAPMLKTYSLFPEISGQVNPGVGFAPFLGSSRPGWVQFPRFNEWLDIFCDEFETAAAAALGVPNSVQVEHRKGAGDHLFGYYASNHEAGDALGRVFARAGEQGFIDGRGA